MNIDSTWPYPLDAGTSIFGINGSNETSINATSLDQLHSLASNLAANGVFIHLNLHSNRAFGIALETANGTKMPEPGGGFVKDDDGLTHFYPPYLQLQKDYARKLLLPVNPYTGQSLASDPGVMTVEITNEDSLFVTWLRGGLDEALETYPELAASLQAQWKAYLAAQNGSVPITAGCTPTAASAGPCILLRGNFSQLQGTVVPQQWLSFLYDVEVQYLQSMRTFLREEIGFQGLIVGSQVQTAPLTAMIDADMDAVSQHGYWADVQSVDNLASLTNVPQSGVEWGGLQPLQAAFRVRGKPFFVSEFNAPNPNQYTAEVPLIQAAMAVAQDFDAAFLYTWSVVHFVPGFGHEKIIIPHSGLDASWVLENYRFAEGSTRVVMCVAASAMMLRDGVTPFAEADTVRVSVSRKMMLNRTLEILKDANSPTWPPSAYFSGAEWGIDPMAGASRRVELVVTDNATGTPDSERSASSPSGGGVAWGNGIVVTRGINVKTFSGFTSSQCPPGGDSLAESPRNRSSAEGPECDLGDGVSIVFGNSTKPTPTGLVSSSQGWAALAMHTVNGTSLKDGEWMAAYDAVLVACSSSWANTNMTWADDARSYVATGPNSTAPADRADWGVAPLLVEGIAVGVALPCPPGERLQATALGADGEPLQSPPLQVQCSGQGTAQFVLNGAASRTLWWVISATAEQQRLQ